LHRHKTLDPADCEFAGHDEHAEIDTAPVTLENVFSGQFAHSAEPVAALYVPGAHREHGPPFAPVAPVLQVHPVTAEVLTKELELPGQLKHRSEEFAPGVPEKLPSQQSVQTALPFALLYLPTAHSMHRPPSGPVAPALHTHDTITLLPAPEAVFVGQFRHAPAALAPTVPENVSGPQSTQLLVPLTSLYFPVPHRTHALPFPVAPALHRHSTLGTSASAYAAQAIHAVAPTPGMYVPAAQFVQTLTMLAPVTPEYCPAGQLRHVLSLLAPSVFEYFPGTHEMHKVAPVALEYMPRGQLTQVLLVSDPTPVEKVPAQQLRQ
jgi:hypothetical protein